MSPYFAYIKYIQSEVIMKNDIASLVGMCIITIITITVVPVVHFCPNQKLLNSQSICMLRPMRCDLQR